MSLSKYLSHYAEAIDIADFSAFPVVDNVLVIPVYDEPLRFIDSLLQFLQSQCNALVIVVLNQPNDEAPCARNMALANRLATLTPYSEAAAALYCAHRSYIYCVHQDLPRKQGVGLARKLGCDIAVHLHQQQKSKSPWLHCSDADVVFPADYFQATETLAASNAAALYPFKHYSNDSRIASHVALYELRLHWYVAGLAWAQSPYAYHTVGSTLAINVAHYCKVRGFPKLAAGEDFHILNKLAKTGVIHSLAAPNLMLDGRESLRVPFGTGRAVAALGEQKNAQAAAVFEAPETFVALQQVLALYPEFWLQGSAEAALRETDFSASVHAALTHVGFDKILSHAFRQSNDSEQFQKQLNVGFDALQSRRFIHYLAKDYAPNMGFSNLLEHPLAATIMPSLTAG